MGGWGSVGKGEGFGGAELGSEGDGLGGEGSWCVVEAGDGMGGVGLDVAVNTRRWDSLGLYQMENTTSN